MSALQEVVQQLEDILKTSNQYGPFVCLDASPPVSVLPLNSKFPNDDSDGIQKKGESSPELLRYDKDIFMSQGLGLDHHDSTDEVRLGGSVGGASLVGFPHSDNEFSMLDGFSSCSGMEGGTYVEAVNEEVEMGIETFKRPSEGVNLQGSDGDSSEVLHQEALAFQVQEGGTVTADSPVPSTCEVNPVRPTELLSSPDPSLLTCAENIVQVVKDGLAAEETIRTAGEGVDAVQPPKRKRGRPRKPVDPNSVPKIKRPRGRPRKNPINVNVHVSAVSVAKDTMDQFCILSNVIGSQDVFEKDVVKGTSQTSEVSPQMFIETQQGVKNDVSRFTITMPVCTSSNKDCNVLKQERYLKRRKDLNIETNVPDELHNYHTVRRHSHHEGVEAEREPTTENSEWAFNDLGLQECNENSTDMDSHVDQGVLAAQVLESNTVTEDSTVSSISEVNIESPTEQPPSAEALFKDGSECSAQVEKCQLTRRKRRRARHRNPISSSKVAPKAQLGLEALFKDGSEGSAQVEKCQLNRRKRRRARHRNPISSSKVAPKAQQPEEEPGKTCGADVEIDAVSFPNNATSECSTLSLAVGVQDSLDSLSLNKDLSSDSFLVGDVRIEDSGDTQEEQQNGLINKCENRISVWTNECGGPREPAIKAGSWEGDKSDNLHNSDQNSGSVHQSVDKENVGTATDREKTDVQRITDHLSTTVTLLETCSDVREQVVRDRLHGEEKKETKDERVEAIQPLKRKRGRPRKHINPSSLVSKIKKPRRPRKIPSTCVEKDALSVPKDQVDRYCTLPHVVIQSSSEDSNCSFIHTCTLATNGDTEKSSEISSSGPDGHSLCETSDSKTLKSGNNGAKRGEMGRQEQSNSSKHHSKDQPRRDVWEKETGPFKNGRRGSNREQTVPTLKLRRKAKKIPDYYRKRHRRSKIVQGIIRSEKCFTGQEISSVTSPLQNAFGESAGGSNEVLHPPGYPSIEPNAPTVQTYVKETESLTQVEKENHKEDSSAQVRNEKIVSDTSSHGQELCTKVMDQSCAPDALPTETITPDHLGASTITSASTLEKNTSSQTLHVPGLAMKQPRGRPRKNIVIYREIRPKDTGYDNQSAPTCTSKEASVPPSEDALQAATYLSESDPSGNKTLSQMCECNGDAAEPQKISSNLNQEREPDVTNNLEPIITTSENKGMKDDTQKEIAKKSSLEDGVPLKRGRGRPRKNASKNKEIKNTHQLVSTEPGMSPESDKFLKQKIDLVGTLIPSSSPASNLASEDTGDFTLNAKKTTYVISKSSESHCSSDSCKNNKKRGRGRPRKIRPVADAVHNVDSCRVFPGKHTSRRKRLLKKVTDQLPNRSTAKEVTVTPSCLAVSEITSSGGVNSPNLKKDVLSDNISSSMPGHSVLEVTDLRLSLKPGIPECSDKSEPSEIKLSSALDGLTHEQLLVEDKQDGVNQGTEVMALDSKSASTCQRSARISQEQEPARRIVSVVCSSETEMYYSKELQKDQHRSMLLRNGCLKRPSVRIKRLPKRLISGACNLDNHSRLTQFLQLPEKEVETMKKKDRIISTWSSEYAHQSSPLKATTPLSSGGRAITPYARNHVPLKVPTSPQKTVKLTYGEHDGKTMQKIDGTEKHLSLVKNHVKHPPTHARVNCMKTYEKGKFLIMDRIKKDAALLRGGYFQTREIQKKFKAAPVLSGGQFKSSLVKKGRGRPPNKFVSVASKVKQKVTKFQARGPLLISKCLFSSKQKDVKNVTFSTKQLHGASVPQKCVQKQGGRPPMKCADHFGSTPSKAKVVETTMTDRENRPKRKVGRPRKNPISVVHDPPMNYPSVKDVPRKRGRPRKNPRPADEVITEKNVKEHQQCSEVKRLVRRPRGHRIVGENNHHVKRKVGRPRTKPVRLEYLPQEQKQPHKTHDIHESPVEGLPPNSTVKIPRKRGRPRKNPVEAICPKYPSVPLPITDNILFGGFGFQDTAFDGFQGTPSCNFPLPVEETVLPVETMEEMEEMPCLETVSSRNREGEIGAESDFAPGSVVSTAKESVISLQSEVGQDDIAGDPWRLEQSQRDGEAPELSCCISVTTKPVLPPPPSISIDLDTTSLPDLPRRQSSDEAIDLPSTDEFISSMTPPDEERRDSDVIQVLTEKALA